MSQTEDLIEKWAGEIQRMRIEHEAIVKRETAKAFQKGRQSAEKAPTSDWVWKGGRFQPPPSDSPTEAL